MKHLGDFDASTVVYGKFTTYQPSTGASFTLAGTPALSVYKDNSTTQSTTGVTLTADFDSVTGLNHFAIDTSADGTFYAAGSFFDIVITAGTVDSVSVVGSVVASFTIRKNSALKPTTAARTLDVSATGEAGVDWANVGSPTTTLNLSGTTISTSQSVLLSAGTGAGQLDFTSGVVKANAVQWVGGTIPAVNVTGVPIVDLKYTLGTISPAAAGSVRADAGDPLAISLPGAYGAGTMGYLIGTYLDAAVSGAAPTAAAVADAVWDEALAGHATAGSAGAALSGASAPTAAAVADAVWDEALSGHTTVGTAGKALSDASTGGDPAAVADAVWDEALAGHATAGSAGATLSAAGSAGDPWSTALPGAYGAGTAGKIIGDNINATIASRAVAGDAMTLTAGERGDVADKLLGRSTAGGSDAGDSAEARSVRNALRGGRNKTTVVGGVMTVTKEDDSTTAWTAAVGTSAGNPISSIDPT